ncbi:MAG: glycosyltransferase, partial [Calothrix sp. C42_A2020_038]|nr:glycosyltransferase [Calothrix sp. C42_A2020_038]
MLESEEAESTCKIELSVIIPCYNQGKYIIEAISSTEQCVKPIYEIIIVNDGSTEELTLEILKDLQNKRYKIINQNNQGLAQARNNGIKAAQGNYILALDADNKIRTNYIIKGVEILNEYPDVGVVYGNSEFFGERHEICEVPDFNIDKLLLGNYIDACAVFRKQVWSDCNGYDYKMPVQGYEDWDLWLSAVEKGWNFYHIPEVTFDYRVRSDSMASFCNIPENRQALIYYICKKHANLYTDKLADVIAAKDFALLNQQIISGSFHTQLQQLQQTHQDTEAEVTKLCSQLEQTQTQLEQTQTQLE